MASLSPSALSCIASLSQRFQSNGLIFRSEAMVNLIEQVAIVSRFNPRIAVLYGENGTGKTGVARVIHEESGRTGRLVTVSPGAMSDELAASEIFGHVKGAYTGADRLRNGAIAEATAGTLFIDDFQDVGPRVQQLLLEFLQTGNYRRLGSDLLLKGNAQVIIATNQDLSRLVQRGKLRSDLYYRVVNEGFIHVPSLRERREDIIPITNKLIEDFNVRHNTNFRIDIDSQTKAILSGYQWPGNIRELEGVVTRWLMASSFYSESGNLLFVEHLNLNPFPNSAMQVPVPSSFSSDLETLPLDRAVRALEARRVIEALRANSLNKAAAARHLGITRNQFRGLLARVSKESGFPPEMRHLVSDDSP